MIDNKRDADFAVESPDLRRFFNKTRIESPEN
jgi:hypothetical protein